MPYYLNEINFQAKHDPAEFIARSDEAFNEQLTAAADRIIEHMKESRIVLLSGPSGSGKTTTAMKLEDKLKKRGVHTHSIALDNYFLTLDPETAPRTPEGDVDFESPLCLDMKLLLHHFDRLSQGKMIMVPKYEFSSQMRIHEPSKALRLGEDEIAIFEGIHALNDDMTMHHPEAFKLYISARSYILDADDGTVFKGNWMRLMRRTVRDKLFRGANPSSTINMWVNVRRGEVSYISPFKDKADFTIDSSFPYEVSVLGPLAKELFASVPEAEKQLEELDSIIPALELFEPISIELLPPDSLLREFVGGGIYTY